MKGVDTHCHLQMDQFDPDLEAVLERALEALEWLVVIGDGIEGSNRACGLVRPGVYASVGFHPYHACDYDDNAERFLRDGAGRPGVVALGEMGLDYHNEFSPRSQQRICFVRQLALAAELGLPAIIHSRSADDDAAAILRDHVPALPACIMHCFGGSVGFAEQCLAMGCYISFAGNVTYPKAEILRDAARLTPPDRLLAETDAPYLAPQNLRGKRCEPAHVMHTLAFLAQIKGIEEDALIRRVVDNASRAYGIHGDGNRFSEH